MTKLEKFVIAALTASLVVSAYILIQRSSASETDINEPTETTLPTGENADGA